MNLGKRELMAVVVLAALIIGGGGYFLIQNFSEEVLFSPPSVISCEDYCSGLSLTEELEENCYRECDNCYYDCGEEYGDYPTAKELEENCYRECDNCYYDCGEECEWAEYEGECRENCYVEEGCYGCEEECESQDFESLGRSTLLGECYEKEGCNECWGNCSTKDFESLGKNVYLEECYGKCISSLDLEEKCPPGEELYYVREAQSFKAVEGKDFCTTVSLYENVLEYKDVNGDFMGVEPVCCSPKKVRYENVVTNYFKPVCEE